MYILSTTLGVTPHSYPLDDRRSPKFATHTDLAKGSLGYNQVIMTFIGCVIHRSCSPVRGPFIRTFSYPHSWHDGVDHQHHSGDSGSPFFLLTDLGKFAKGSLGYNDSYWLCHSPVLLPCSWPFVRTFSYPHSQHDSVDHPHYSNDSRSLFVALTDLGKFAK